MCTKFDHRAVRIAKMVDAKMRNVLLIGYRRKILISLALFARKVDFRIDFEGMGYSSSTPELNTRISKASSRGVAGDHYFMRIDSEIPGMLAHIIKSKNAILDLPGKCRLRRQAVFWINHHCTRLFGDELELMFKLQNIPRHKRAAMQVNKRWTCLLMIWWRPDE